MAKIKRPGSGRTKGSYSFTQLTLAQLNAKFADKNTPITVGRKFAETAGFTGLTTGPANALAGADTQVNTPVAPKSCVSVTDLNAPATAPVAPVAQGN